MAKEAQHIAELSTTERAALVSRLKQQRAAEREGAQAITRRATAAHYPLSFAQERLWFLEQLEPDGPYKVPAAFRLRGPLQVAALEQSVNEIINRHEVLRTTIAEIEGRPVQIVAPRLTLSIPVEDLTRLPEIERAERLKQISARLRERSFDFVHGPLVGAALLKLTDEEYHFWFLMHHIVSDGWSIGVFLKELSTAYEAFAAGRHPELPKLSIQYADFAVWQRTFLQGETLDRQMKYWKERLGTNVSTLELPTDRPRPPVQSYNGQSLTYLIDLELAEQVKALARRESVTPYMLLLAVFKTLLKRYTRQEDIVVGTPVANRNRTELEPLIGFFVNTLVLRTDLSGDLTFRELLARIRDVTLGAFAHQDVPFEKLVEELQPERDTSRTPFFQVMFSLQNAPLPLLRMGDIEISLLDDETEVSLFDLSFDVIEREDGLLCTLEYNTGLFDAATVGRMLKNFTVLLDAAVTDPSMSLGALPLLTDEEQDQLFKWNETRRDFQRDRCVHELFEEQTARTPEAVALVCRDEQLTYAELNAQANRLARHLRACGVGAETRVGILLEREARAGVALLAVLKAGSAWMALDTAYPPSRLAFMLEDAETSVLLTTTQLAASLPAHTARLVCLDAEAQQIESQAVNNLKRFTDPANLAYIVYTSGTTGHPKGTLVEHHSLVNTSLGFAAQHRLTPHDRLFQFASLSFDVAAEEFFAAWLSGAPAVMQPPQGFDTITMSNYEPGETGAAHLRTHAGPIDRPIANAELYILDARQQLVPVGVIGEIYIGGAGVPRGYHRRPALTAEQFLPHPYAQRPGARLYRTGGLGRFLPDGNIESFPLTPNGKLDRTALPASNGAGHEADGPYVAPRSELENVIAGVWREALGIERVGVQDNFFSLGGHSLLLIRVNNRLRETLRTELPVVELFKYPTVSALAEHLSQSHAQPRATARAGRSDAEGRAAALSRQRELRLRRGKSV